MNEKNASSGCGEDECCDGGERGRGAHIKIWPPGGYRQVTCDYLLLDVRPHILDRVRVLLESSLRDPLGNHISVIYLLRTLARMWRRIEGWISCLLDRSIP